MRSSSVALIPLLMALGACSDPATAPDATAPDATAPDATAPDATAPDATAPDAVDASAPSDADVAATDTGIADVDLGPLGTSPFSRRCVERVEVVIATADYDRILAQALDPAAGTSLSAVKDIVVPATVTFTSCDDDVHTASAMFRLKGKTTATLQPIDRKPSFKLSFAALDPADRPFGEERLTFDNLVHDAEFIRQALAADIFARLGVPAPRVGFGEVTLNGVPRGLYTIVETPGADFCARSFPTTQQLIEVEGPIAPDFSLTNLQLDYEVGPEDPTVLAELIAAFPVSGDETDLIAATAGLVDWDAILAEMAAEILAGQGDGFVNGHHYFVHVAADGLIRIVPWAFDEAQAPGYELGLGGALGCKGRPACVERLTAALEDGLARLRPTLAADIVQLANLTVAAATRESHLPGGTLDPAAVIYARQMQLLAQIRGHEALAASMRCALDPSADEDHDGSPCRLDCALLDPGSHPGAVDTCGDGIDQDCNSEVDDGPTCEDCIPLDASSHPLWVCSRPRTFDAARAKCRSLGGDLVRVDTQGELLRANDASAKVALTLGWIGMTVDSGGRGFYLDGAPVPFAADGLYGPSCAVTTYGEGFGAWSCTSRHPAICEPACAVGQDADGDGFLACGDDCDDDDGDVHPGAQEVQCGVDLACDAAVMACP